MSNTNKGMPATCYHQAKIESENAGKVRRHSRHKTTLKQRRANREKGLIRWLNR